MNSVIIPIAGGVPNEPPPLLDPSNLSARIASVADGQSILRIIKDEENHLDIGATSKGFIISEQYGKKCFHLKGTATLDEAVQLARRYEKDSVSEATNWYPTLIEGRNLRFSNPRLFSLLNERYRISNPIALCVVLITAMAVIVACFALGSVLGTRSKLVYAPFAIYALIVAKRIDFVDPTAKRYGYSG